MAIIVPQIKGMPLPKDPIRVYRRVYWPDSPGQKHLGFVWNHDEKAFRYVTYDESNKSVAIRHMTGNSPSLEVTSAFDLEYITIGKKQSIKNKGSRMKSDVNYIGTGYKVVEVSYEIEGQDLLQHHYSFKTDLDLVEGNLAVVESSNGLSMVRVVKDAVPKSLDKDVVASFNRAKAWVVDIIDTTAQDARREATERKAFIMQELEERKEAVAEKAIYKMLAETDPEAKKLLEELDAIDAVIVSDK